jgi:hypothetical protein
MLFTTEITVEIIVAGFRTPLFFLDDYEHTTTGLFYKCICIPQIDLLSNNLLVLASRNHDIIAQCSRVIWRYLLFVEYIVKEF